MTTDLKIQSTNKRLTSQHPKGSPLAASNPADMMVRSGANSEAAIISHWKPLMNFS